MVLVDTYCVVSLMMRDYTSARFLDYIHTVAASVLVLLCISDIVSTVQRSTFQFSLFQEVVGLSYFEGERVEV